MKTIVWISVKLRQTSRVVEQLQKIDGIEQSGDFQGLAIAYAVFETKNSEKITSKIREIPDVVSVHPFTADVDE